MNLHLKRLGVFVGLLLASLTSAKAQAKNAGNLKEVLPVALIIAINDYEHEDDLKNCVASALDLGERLVENRYRLTFVTEPVSLPDVTARFGKANGVRVIECDSTDKLKRIIDDWLTKDFNTTVPFGFLVFSGHGEQRGGTTRPIDYFLGPDDRAGLGGINIRDLKVNAGREMIPLVLILDMCRLLSVPRAVKAESDPTKSPEECEQVGIREVAESEDLKMIKANRGNRYNVIMPEAKARDAEEQDIGPITTVWASPENAITSDSSNGLLHCLADGLKHVDKPEKMFHARFMRYVAAGQQKDLLPVEHTNDLSLMTWLIDAVRRLALIQPIRHERGLVDDIMIVGSRNKNFRFERPSMSVLGGWNGFTSGGFDTLVDSSGVTFICAAGKNQIATSFFGGQIDPVGKAAYLELMAWSPTPSQVDGLSCLIHPSDYTQNGEPFIANRNFLWKLKFNVPQKIWIPFGNIPAGGKLNAITIAASANAPWPDGARMTVTKLHIVDLPQPKKTDATLHAGPIELMSRWWFSDILEPDGSASEVRAWFEVDNKHQRKFELQLEQAMVNQNNGGELLGKGGLIYPPIFVSSDQRQVAVETLDCVPHNPGAQQCEIQVIMLSNDEILLSDKIRVKAKAQKTRHLLDVKLSGVPTYFALMSKDAKSISISDIAVVRKR